MGIKYLASLTKRYAPDSISHTNIKSHKGKTYAIDISIYMYRFVYNNGNHVESFCKQIMRLVRNGITPLYIFDGKPPKEKSETIKERVDRKREISERIEKLVQLRDEESDGEVSETESIVSTGESKDKIADEIEKLQKKMITITRQHNEDVVTLFELLGIPFIIANGEAEWLCSKLNKIGLVDYCISEDMDVLPNGASKFIRGLSINSNNAIIYDLDKVLQGFDMTMDQFIDTCILCGCDYCPKIYGIGSLTAYKLIKEHGSIEKIIENVCNKTEKYRVVDGFDYVGARNLFKRDIPEDDMGDYKKYMKKGKVDIAGLTLFLQEKCPLVSREMILFVQKHMMDKASKKIEKETDKKQPSITNFFTKK